MNNYTLKTADRLTHLKIVAVSLVAGIVVVGIGIAARPLHAQGVPHARSGPVILCRRASRHNRHRRAERGSGSGHPPVPGQAAVGPV